MIIEVYTKNFARTHSVEVPDSPVPRVGETITFEQGADDLQGITELLVHDVTYILAGNALTPLIRCHASNGSDHRLLVLIENGWLQPAHD